MAPLICSLILLFEKFLRSSTGSDFSVFTLFLGPMPVHRDRVRTLEVCLGFFVAVPAIVSPLSLTPHELLGFLCDERQFNKQSFCLWSSGRPNAGSIKTKTCVSKAGKMQYGHRRDFFFLNLPCRMK